jgi:streptomycin 6-kinase
LRELDVPDAVRRSAESQGAAGLAWLAALPGLVDELCRRWSLSLGEVLHGGKWAFVARVRAGDGASAVLKVAPPSLGFAEQVGTIRAAGGLGYVRVFDVDLDRYALLMEPLGERLSAAGHAVERVLDVLAATLREAWRVPLAVGDVAEVDVVGGLVRILDELWPLLDEPCSARLIGVARVLLLQRAAGDSDGWVVCHGDPHADNALAVLSPRAGAESGYVFVDPDGFLCEPAYDLGVAMRGWTGEVLRASDPVGLTRAWAGRLASATGVDERALWEWGLIQRVTTGLHLMRHGHREEGRAFLASAERLV